ncbi:MAG: LysM peptidoglycan-binding domain-containing protein [Desulfobacteraceae bacterium]|nr:LysM peptidoglycan-binding domain-containing protein [Desulfobacteraceae bacterium]
MNIPRTKTIAMIVTLVLLLSTSVLLAATDPFPMPDVIAPNVAFWTKVYSQYATSQGIVHDSDNLNIIYEVIPLLPYEHPGAAKTNRRRMKEANEKYERILKQLAKAPDTANEECRRVAALFDPPCDAHGFRLAATRVRCQIGQKDRFQAGLIRSGAYMDQIQEILRQKGLPEDIAYLPHVESSFNPNAYSKFGAAGVWQFTRSTGKRFMNVGYAVDERRDPILATYAAADLLSENYETLGSWPLAITAYNHGTSGMQRAKNQHGEYEEVFKSYQSRSFKFASRNFYSEFLAARQVASNYKAYFGDLPLDRPLPCRSVVLEGYVAMKDLSRHFGTDAQTIKQLNPALRQPVFNGQKLIPKGYSLRLPASSEAKEPIMTAAVPSTLYKTAQKPSNFYTVQDGDTAGQIARTHGVQLSDLILANNLDRHATVYPHQTLRIPLPDDHLKAPLKPVTEPSEPTLIAKMEPPAQKAAPEPVPAADAPATKIEEPHGGQTTVAQKESPPTSSATVSEPPAPAPTPAKPEITAEPVLTAKAEPPAKIEPQETAAQTAPKAQAAPTVAKASEPAKEPVHIAAVQDTTPVEPPYDEDRAESDKQSAAQETTSADDKSQTSQQPGSTTGRYPQPVLASVIPVGPVEPAPAATMSAEAMLQARNEQIVTADVKFERMITVDGRPVGILRVEVEETLGHYAEWANVRTQQIRNLNKLKFGTVLQPNQKVKIPLYRTTASDFEQTRYEYHKRLQEDFFAVYRIGELQPYNVQRGDTCWTLCQDKFEIPMWLLKHCNPEADLSDLKINQQLMIPTIEKASPDDAGSESDDEQEPQDEAPAQSGGEG